MSVTAVSPTKTLQTKIQLKNDSTTNWETSTYVPLRGEMIIYSADSSHSKPRIKIGDGSTAVPSLPFVGEEGVGNFVITDTTAASDNLVPDATMSPVTSLTPVTGSIIYVALGRDMPGAAQATISFDGGTTVYPIHDNAMAQSTILACEAGQFLILGFFINAFYIVGGNLVL